jgi:hypothetical protein
MMRLACYLAMPLIATSTLTFAAQGGWQKGKVVGALDIGHLAEASGLAASSLDDNLLFHINDSGSAPTIILTDRRGGDARTVQLNVDQVTDTEELALAACPDQGSCLYIGDMGDNDFARSFITIHAVRERDLTKQLSPESVTPAFSIDLVYPDGKAHNAESLAIHPGGYVYILTKEIPAVFYRFPLEEFISFRGSKGSYVKKVSMEKVGFVTLSSWLDGSDKPKKIIPTSMAIRPDGKQIAVLTRAAGVTIDVDLMEAFTAGNQNLNQIINESGAHSVSLPMIQLPQSEAVTYINGGTSLLYSSEISNSDDKETPLVQMDAMSGKLAKSF